ncbi:hypothetical protein CONPUDRAFT_28415, partial [Coniophora puteana RWD-64-598 SS2]
PEPGILWLSGESGSGKSSVAHTFADSLHSKGKLAVTFFFSRKDIDRRNLNRFFVTIGYQLGLAHPRAREVVIKAI